MRAAKVWLITWECEGENAQKSIRNKIAAVLPIRSAGDFVERVMKLLYFNQHAQGKQRLYLETQLQGLTEMGGIKKNRMRIMTSLFGTKSFSSSNPWLKARVAFNYKVEIKRTKTEEYCIAKWEEEIEFSTSRLSQEEIEAKLPLKRREMQYNTKRNVIEMNK
jgi:hypothetical protein